MCPTTKTAPCNDACKLMQSNLKWNTTGEVEKSPCGKKPNFGKLQIHSLFIHPSTQRSSSCLSFSPLHFSFSPLGRWKWLLLLEKRGGGVCANFDTFAHFVRLLLFFQSWLSAIESSSSGNWLVDWEDCIGESSLLRGWSFSNRCLLIFCIGAGLSNFPVLVCQIFLIKPIETPKLDAAT